MFETLRAWGPKMARLAFIGGVGAWLSLGPAPALEAPTRVVLPNGIPLIVQETYSSPTVSINIFLRCGSMNETPELNGIAHFYEHMFFRGTPSRSGLEFKRQIEALGGTTNAETTRDFTHFYINLPEKYVDKGLELLADAYINAEVAQTSVDQERDVVLEEWRIGKDSPGRIINDRMYGMMFKNHPYGRPIIGTEEKIQGITRADLLNWKRTYYVPARTSLVVVGECDKQRVIARCKELFGGYHAAPPPPDKFDQDSPPPDTVKVVEDGPVGRSIMVYGFLAPAVKELPDVYQVDLMTFLIGVGKGSLLAQAMGPDSPDSAECGFLTQTYPGIITVTVSCDPKEEDATKAKVDQVIAKVEAGDFSDEDLARARTLLCNSYRFQAETNAGKAGNLGFYETLDKMDFATQYLARVKKVTRADVIAVAKKYLGRPHYQFVMHPGGGKRRS